MIQRKIYTYRRDHDDDDAFYDAEVGDVLLKRVASRPRSRALSRPPIFPVSSLRSGFILHLATTLSIAETLSLSSNSPLPPPFPFPPPPPLSFPSRAKECFSTRSAIRARLRLRKRSARRPGNSRSPSSSLLAPFTAKARSMPSNARWNSF